MPLHVRDASGIADAPLRARRFHCGASGEDVRSALRPFMHSEPAERSREVALRRLEDNLAGVRRRVEVARARSPRSSRVEPTLMVVTKAAPPGGLPWLSKTTARDVGENRVVAAAEKRASA